MISGIAFEAQCAEYDLRKAHFDFTVAAVADSVENRREVLDTKLERAELHLERLRERFRELVIPVSNEKADERAIDRAALDSLEGQIATYRHEFTIGAAAFARALNNLKDAPLRHFGAKVLATRSTLVLYYCSHMCGVDVRARVADPTFVRMAKLVASVTGDARILILIAEAVASLEQHDRAAQLLYEAANLRSMPIEDLQTYQPVGYAEALGAIPELVIALARVPDIAVRAADAARDRRRRLHDHAGVPEDVTLHLPCR